MFAVELKISVQGEHDAIFVQFRHANQTGIGQRHGNIRILSYEIAERLCVGVQAEGNLDNLSINELSNRPTTTGQSAQKETRLCQYSLTREQRRFYLR